VPRKPAAGVYLILAPSISSIVPFGGGATKGSSAIASPSGSLSLAVRLIVTAVLLQVVAASSSASGGRLVLGLSIVMTTSARAEPPFPSMTS
jgi:hypothetical protein